MRALPVANPESRFAKSSVTYDSEEHPGITLQIYEDRSQTILASNDSPDVGFRYSVNPYRGCFHGCSYCYARPTHEYLSFGAGTDFERRIVVKPEAGALLRRAFDKKSWQGELVVFSGVTDCYQPIEARLGLTRACLEVCIEYRNPAGFITKSTLIERDVELLQRLAEVADTRVTISLPFWDADIAKAMEPFVTTKERRLRTIERLARAGIPVGVSIAPVIPGLNDEDIPKILGAARAAGASHAFYTLLRLPGSVRQIFEDRLRQTLPLRADRVLGRLGEAREGRLDEGRFGTRMKGTGPYAAAIQTLFCQTARRLGLDGQPWNSRSDETTFRRPERTGQLSLGLE